MTEHDAALQLDRALDGLPAVSLNGAQPLLATAETMQGWFDDQHDIPSEEFILRLERSLFADTVVPGIHPVVPSEAEGPPAAAVLAPQPRPLSRRTSRDRRRIPHLWLAVAATLALILGGGGAVLVGPVDWHSPGEPSSIPSVGFGTVEASPAPVSTMWTVEPPDRNETMATVSSIAGGVTFRIVSDDTGSVAHSGRRNQ